MLMDEIEVEELGINPLHEDVPGCGNGEEDGRTREEVYGLQDAPFVGDQHPREDDHAGDDDADEPLGEDGEGCEGKEAPK